MYLAIGQDIICGNYNIRKIVHIVRLSGLPSLAKRLP